MGRIPSAIEEADADAQTAHTSMLSVANQIAVATRSSDQTVGLNLNASYEITDRYPELVELIQAGRVSFAHAKVIAPTSGANLPENVRDTYLKRAIYPNRARDHAGKTPSSAPQTRGKPLTRIDRGRAQTRKRRTTSVG